LGLPEQGRGKRPPNERERQTGSQNIASSQGLNLSAVMYFWGITMRTA
jgi:hypothetical protein